MKPYPPIAIAISQVLFGLVNLKYVLTHNPYFKDKRILALLGVSLSVFRVRPIFAGGGLFRALGISLLPTQNFYRNFSTNLISCTVYFVYNASVCDAIYKKKITVLLDCQELSLRKFLLCVGIYGRKTATEYDAGCMGVLVD